MSQSGPPRTGPHPSWKYFPGVLSSKVHVTQCVCNGHTLLGGAVGGLSFVTTIQCGPLGGRGRNLGEYNQLGPCKHEWPKTAAKYRSHDQRQESMRQKNRNLEVDGCVSVSNAKTKQWFFVFGCSHEVDGWFISVCCCCSNLAQLNNATGTHQFPWYNRWLYTQKLHRRFVYQIIT
jgi:hypothetical protein